MELGCVAWLFRPLGQVLFHTLFWLGVPESLRWGDDGHVQTEDSLLGASRSWTGLTTLAVLLFVCSKPHRFSRDVAVWLATAAGPEVLASANISGEAVGARPEAQTLGLRRTE